MHAIILFSLFCTAFAAPRQMSRIIGGSPITIDEFPFMSNMQYHYWEIVWDQACGGTLITPGSVLSAAHCYSQDSATNWRVRLGSSYASSGGTVHEVLDIVLHEDYDDNTMENDVAIIRLVNRAALGETIFVARIAGPNYYLGDDDTVTAVGWGAIDDNGALSEQLRYVYVSTVNQRLCSERYSYLRTQPGNENLPYITDGMICTGVLGSDSDNGKNTIARNTCQGDFGGPLLHTALHTKRDQRNLLSDYTVVGISSWVYRCADEYYPGVNTRVSHYSNWIAANA